MTEPTRGPRQRRSVRRPGWILLTVLLVLAIVASSALVFTNKVELLKLAVIFALWAAVVAAFISFLYRRQSDVDQAKVRDLKLVYDLQLDREISARREYELSVETHLRRELASELRAQAGDEVASLRAELAALRANLEILFDTDLQHRPAIENERTAVHTFGRVISSRIDTEPDEDFEPHTDESPIIDVPAEPHPSEEWLPSQPVGGAHRRASESEPSGARARVGGQERSDRGSEFGGQERVERGSEFGGQERSDRPNAPEPEVRLPWLSPAPPPAATNPPAAPPPPPPPPTQPPPIVGPPPPVVTSPPPATPPASPWQEPQRAAAPQPGAPGWQPVAAEGRFIPAGEPGSNWVAKDNGVTAPPPQPSPPPAAAEPAPPAMAPPPPGEARRGRHSSSDAGAEPPPRSRHSAAAEPGDPGRPTPTLATPASSTNPPPPLAAETPKPTKPEPAEPVAPEAPRARHRGTEDPGRGPSPEEDDGGQHAGGQPLSELMARLQVSSTGGGRRRRRED